MEQNSLQRRAGLKDKGPELERSIQMVEMLQEKKVRLPPLIRADLVPDLTNVDVHANHRLREKRCRLRSS